MHIYCNQSESLRNRKEEIFWFFLYLSTLTLEVCFLTFKGLFFLFSALKDVLIYILSFDLTEIRNTDISCYKTRLT